MECKPDYLTLCLLLYWLFQVEVEFANGSKFNLSAEYLRIHSPAADGKIRSVGGEKVEIQTFFLILNIVDYFWFIFILGQLVGEYLEIRNIVHHVSFALCLVPQFFLQISDCNTTIG